MITQSDVLETMRAVDPSTTEAEATRQFETINRALDTRKQQLGYQMRRQFKDRTGDWPDSLTSEQILDRADLDAENQIRGEYLDELTALATEQGLQAEEEQLELDQEMLKQSPDAWKTQWREMLVPNQMLDLAVDLWPDEAETPETRYFYNIAAALLTSMEYRGLIIPTSPSDEGLSELQAEVHKAIQADPDNR